MKRVIGLIPARYASTRFPGKPLAILAGKPMIQWTYEQTCQAKMLDDVYVATDDNRIAQCVRNFGGKVIMTNECPSGSDRCWSALLKAEAETGLRYDIVANIQGDEPLVNPVHIDLMVNTLLKALPQGIKMSALAAPIKNEEEARNRAISKVVMDRYQNALYFSRAMIPHSKSGEYNPDVTYYRNCGMYCYERDFLGVFASTSLMPGQIEEDLEQVKVLEMGERVKLGLIDEAEGGIDYPEQLAQMNERVKRKLNPR